MYLQILISKELQIGQKTWKDRGKKAKAGRIM